LALAVLRAPPLPELISRYLSEYPAISATTVNKTLTLVGAIVAHTERDGYLEDVAGFVSPFRNMLVARDKNDDDDRLRNGPGFAGGHLD
jgi:hypothetical protein